MIGITTLLLPYYLTTIYKEYENIDVVVVLQTSLKVGG